MFTQRQYDFFKTLYDEESARYTELENRAKLYLGVITLYVGAIAFKIEDVSKFARTVNIPWPVLLVVGLLFLVSLLLTILAIKIRHYEGISEPEDILAEIGDAPPTDEEFFEDRIVDLAVATKRNVEQNNKNAELLNWASIALAGGVGLHLVIFATALFRL